MSRSYSDIAARIRVPAGFFLGLLYIVFARPTRDGLFWGTLIAMTGLTVRAAAAGYLAKNQSLATGGPYAYIRHPLYLGSMLAGIGYCIAGGRWWFFVLLFLFLGAIYWPVIRREELHLSRLFAEDHGPYARTVPFLLPRFSAWPTERRNPSRFRWALYLKNHEYRAFFAFVAIVFILLIKLYY
ncbi:MAG: isoprenylcysteine carboxylmethyltransferase family protein [Acidobacteria bacterium]|nr:isoprenylcysteine carboxylmethyltransferase family protein [Acidobacteriota bacterium]